MSIGIHRCWQFTFRCQTTGTPIPDPPFPPVGPSRDYGMNLCLEVYIWDIYPYFTTFRVTTLSFYKLLFLCPAAVLLIYTWDGNIPIDQIFSKLHCEKLHLKFCKFLLGVHKKSTNLAIQSELGRFPLHFDILKQILRFWHRLENLDSSFPLLKAAYKCTKHL